MLDKVAKINPWGSAFEVNGLKRDKYIEKIIPFFTSNLIKVLTGQRRSGKSQRMDIEMTAILDIADSFDRSYCINGFVAQHYEGMDTSATGTSLPLKIYLIFIFLQVPAGIAMSP